ncbi:MAG: phosphotransferase [Chloroflexota bacterium]|nr:phosphotransferase [Chloroflexota bacterium]
MSELNVPRDLREVTPSWLTAALCGGGAAGASVVDYAAELIGDGTGFMSQLYRLRLEYDDVADGQPRSLVLKLPSSDPHMRSYFDRVGQNQREALFYRQRVADGLLHTPLSYYCGADPSTGDTAILLEDLSDSRQGDSVAGCTQAEAELAVTQLARFQAAWWGGPQLDALDWLPSKDSEAAFYTEIYADAWREFVGKAGVGMPAGMRGVGDRLEAAVAAIKSRLVRAPQTILHGDYRLDNFFFPSAEGAPPLVVFDWEFCVRGRGAYDVATFVSETFSTEQRRVVEMDLLRLYHATLAAHGVTDYSFDECVEDYRLSMLEILVFWIVTGGYCVYEGERANTYLHGALARFDAAIADLDCAALLAV